MTKVASLSRLLRYIQEMMMGFEPTISVLQTDAFPLGHIIIKVLDGI